MKFKDLTEIKREINLSYELFGATPEALRVMNEFHQFMKARYTPAQTRSTFFLESDVPLEVLEEFRELYGLHVAQHRAVTGEELESLPRSV